MELKLKELRKKHNLTQDEMSIKLSIPKTTYCGYEQEIRKIPLDVLCKIADIFGVSLDELAGRTQKEWSFTRDDLLDKIFEFSKMLPDNDLCLILGRIMALVEKQEQGK